MSVCLNFMYAARTELASKSDNVGLEHFQGRRVNEMYILVSWQKHELSTQYK